ncbi:MAG: hypothetical protein A3H79_03435 [Candidatus Levybacteria bacterium RIFCSPLOWO2_02_FULL_36_8b]|nr:MAG: hypothetical protein A3H79_03435 [Candidatus Levybacteria bacterium RIFCSPLOWO2_02_FULL_36_8b]
MPTLLMWIYNFKILRLYKKTLFACVFWALVFSVPWDYWAIKTKIWNFPNNTNLGIWFGGLPLEEYLFIIFVTFEISTLTLVLKNKIKSNR